LKAINHDKDSVFSRTLILIMLLSPKGSEREHAPDTLRFMTTDRILAAIDNEIARLNEVRALLSTSAEAGKDKTASPVRKRRKLSAAARKRIAEAQRKRWAKQKGSAAGK
jgi:hypothetical protein